MVFKPSGPLSGPRGRERARTPARSIRLGRGHRAGGVTPVEARHRPRGQTINPRLSPRSANRAVGGIRAWDENPGRRASSLATVLRSRALVCAHVKKSARTPPRARVDLREDREGAVGVARTRSKGQQTPTPRTRGSRSQCRRLRRCRWSGIRMRRRARPTVRGYACAGCSSSASARLTRTSPPITNVRSISNPRGAR
jgi:hypothetical protein